MEHELIWQPLSTSKLSTFELAVDSALTAIEKRRIMLSAAIQSHQLMDTDPPVEPIRIDETQQHVLMIYAEQGRRWQKVNPTGALQQQLDKVLTKITQAMIVDAKVSTVLALIRAMGTHSQNKNWLTAVRTMLSRMSDDVPTKAFAWAEDVLQQQDWTIGQQIELRRLWSLVWLAYNDVAEALWEIKVAMALSADAATPADHVTYAKLCELMIQCWLRQEDAVNAIDAVMTLVGFVDIYKDSLVTQPDGSRLWLEAAYYRAFVAEFGLDYPTAATWYAEAQQRSHLVELATHHPMRRLIAAGMARTTKPA